MIHLKKIANRGYIPLYPLQKDQRTKASKDLLSGADRPHIVVRGLLFGVDVAIVQEHEPRAAGTKLSFRRTRPIVARMDVCKGVI